MKQNPVNTVRPLKRFIIEVQAVTKVKNQNIAVLLLNINRHKRGEFVLDMEETGLTKCRPEVIKIIKGNLKNEQ